MSESGAIIIKVLATWGEWVGNNLQDNWTPTTSVQSVEHRMQYGRVGILKMHVNGLFSQWRFVRLNVIVFTFTMVHKGDWTTWGYAAGWLHRLLVNTDGGDLSGPSSSHVVTQLWPNLDMWFFVYVIIRLLGLLWMKASFPGKCWLKISANNDSIELYS